MSDYNARNQGYDPMPPARSSGVTGPLLLVGGIIVLVFLALFLLGSDGGAPVAPNGAAPAAVEGQPATPEAIAPSVAPPAGVDAPAD